MAACICFASLVGLAVRDLVSKPYTLQKDKYDIGASLGRMAC